MAGYSGTPLTQKLGIKARHRLLLVGAPPGFDATLAPLPDDVDVRRTGEAGSDSDSDSDFDVAVAFVTDRAELVRLISRLPARMAADGGLWVAWPKRASGVPTDVTEHMVRETALPVGLVDNKVCAIDETWSGLRLVIRRELRAAHRR